MKPRARDLGVPFEGEPGPMNAITDVAGVLVGHMFQANAKPDLPVITVPPVTTQATPQVTPAPVKPQPQNEDRQLAAAPPRYTDEKGVIVVETTLKGSGARALWVIDGGFQLAQSSAKP